MDDFDESSPFRWPWLAVFLLLALGAARASLADHKVNFKLDAGEFPRAILEFSHQTRLEVLFLADDSLYMIHTQPVIGEFDPYDALERMLKGTGLTFYFDTPHSVIIKRPNQSAPDPAPRLSSVPAPPEVSLTPLSLAATPAGDDSEVVVTGSFIHTALEVPAPLMSLTQKDFSEAPFGTVQDTLHQLPINSLDAPREDLFLYENFNFGSGVNLRGLGVPATLVLVNGYRQPFSGLNGDFVDVSNIPTAAIDRIEILADGASAAYGSDAIGGVVNIIMKDDFEGAETHLQQGSPPGGRNSLIASQLFGAHWDTGKAMLAYQFEDGSALPASSRGYAANADKRPYGGADYRSYFGDPGNILDPRTLQPIYGIRNQSGALSSTINLENQFAQDEMFPQRTSHAFYTSVSQQMLDTVELFVEGRFTKRSTVAYDFPDREILVVPTANPFNPFGGTTLVSHSFLRTLGAAAFGAYTENYMGTVGARFKFVEDWKAVLTESYGREALVDTNYNFADRAAVANALASTDPTAAFDAFGQASPSALASIRGQLRLRALSVVQDARLVADGPVWELPAGAAKLAAGIEHREETLDHTGGEPYGTAMVRYSRHINSAFSELLIPILGDSQRPKAASRLEADIAARYDDYSDFGHTANPEIRLRWSPFDWVKLRASWGRSYRAPTLDDLRDDSNNVSSAAVLPDPKSPTGRSTVLGMQGNNPALKQETAITWTAGVDLVPNADPGLKISMTYFSVDYRDQIASPAAANPYAILVQENEWASFITRNPTPAQIAAVCNRPDYLGSRLQCLASSPAAIVDIRLANLSETTVSGLDLDAHQTIDSFDFGLKGSYLFHFDQSATNTSPRVEILNSFGNQLKLRLRATAGWQSHRDEKRGFGTDIAVNFTNRYRNPDSALLPHVDSLTTLDLQLHYSIPQGPRSLDGIVFSLNAVNIFNQSPPFSDSSSGYDANNFQGLGRVITAAVTKTW